MISLNPIKSYYKRQNIKFVLFSVLLSVLILLELIGAGSYLLADSRLVQSLESVSNIVHFDIVETNGSFTIKGPNNFVIIPASESYTRVRIYLTSDIQDLKARCYFTGDEGFSFEQSVASDIDYAQGIIEFRTNERTGSIKVKFISDASKSYAVNISKIEFYNDVVVLGRNLLLKAGIVFLLLVLVVYLLITFLAKIVGYGDKNGILWACIMGSAVLAAALLFLTNSYYWAGYFHMNSKDTFMDYFNMLSLLQADDVYYKDANYPAMCFVFFKAMYSFLYPKFQVLNDPVALRVNNVSLMGFCVILIICLTCIVILIKGILRNQRDKNLAYAILCTGTILGLIERGNLLIISFVFLLVYFRFYDSEDKRLRYLSYISLSLSASIKLYPALFGILTLKRKSIKETIHLAIMGMVTFVLPFFYFDGFVTIKKWLHGMGAANELLTSQGTGDNFALKNLFMIVGLLVGKSIEIPQLILVLTLVVLCTLAIVNSVQWEVLFLIATACIWFPAFSFTYVLVLYIPALIAYMNTEDNQKSLFDGILLVATQLIWLLPMMPYLDSFMDKENMDLPMNVSTLLINFVIVALFFKVLLNMFARYLSNVKPITLSFRRVAQINVVIIALLIGTVSIAVYNRSAGLEKYFTGKGTPWNPYQIQTVEDFEELVDIANNGNALNGVYFEQTANLVFDGEITVDPVGWSNKKASFAGVYDGNGYSIRNYYSVSDHDEDMGLFGELSGEVRNVNLENCNIGGTYVGGIACNLTSKGKIVNCSVSGLLWGYQAGGIVALNSGKIENCVAYVAMNTQIQYGISEDSSSSEVINSYSSVTKNVNRVAVMDGNTLFNLNNHTALCNKRVFKNYELCGWVIEDGVLKVDTTKGETLLYNRFK